MMSCLSSHWSDILRTQYNDVLLEFPLVSHSQDTVQYVLLEFPLVRHSQDTS